MIETSTTNKSLEAIIEHLNKLWPDETTGIAKNWEAKKWTPEALWDNLVRKAREAANGDSHYYATNNEVYGWAVHAVIDEAPDKPSEATPKKEAAKPRPQPKPKAGPKKEDPKAKWTKLEEGRDYTADGWKDLEKGTAKKSDCEQMSLFG